IRDPTGADDNRREAALVRGTHSGNRDTVRLLLLGREEGPYVADSAERNDVHASRLLLPEEPRQTMQRQPRPTPGPEWVEGWRSGSGRSACGLVGTRCRLLHVRRDAPIWLCSFHFVCG